MSSDACPTGGARRPTRSADTLAALRVDGGMETTKCTGPGRLGARSTAQAAAGRDGVGGETRERRRRWSRLSPAKLEPDDSILRVVGNHVLLVGDAHGRATELVLVLGC